MYGLVSSIGDFFLFFFIFLFLYKPWSTDPGVGIEMLNLLQAIDYLPVYNFNNDIISFLLSFVQFF